jgi:colanic acid/amylovoran biosynthesis glycosyltransferase
MPNPPGSICYITTNGIGGPWVAAELKIIQQRGIRADLHSMRTPELSFFDSDWAQRINNATEHIYPLPIASFAVSLLIAPLLFRAKFFSALYNALFSERESIRARIAGTTHLFVACHWARMINSRDYKLIHSQWIQSAGTIGFYAAWLLDIPFSFTGHAVDLFRERCALKDKISRAEFIVAISEFHKQFYIDEGASPNKIHIVYCGIELNEYPYNFSPPSDAIRILSFGRLVEKKGFDTLVHACNLLREDGIDFQCEIAGSGPEYGSLVELVSHFGLEDFVTITGKPLKQEEIQEWMSKGDIFAQPCCWSSDNDVDGIPRSLMEAMAIGLPSISTRVAGIPDLIEHQTSGLLIAERDAAGLAQSICILAKDRNIMQKMSAAGRRTVEERFNLDDCLDPLVKLYNDKVNVNPITENEPGT